MSRLELKVPPDVVWLVVAALMWLASVGTPRVAVPVYVRLATAASLAGAGVWVVVAARIALERAHTSWLPQTPGQATSLVTSGVYGMSRNPIYLGMLLVIVAWAVVLASPVAVVLSTTFVLYLDRFQIFPEERALSVVIGQEYLDYRVRVRRWI